MEGSYCHEQRVVRAKSNVLGMTNSPATFQALMNWVFTDLIAEGQVAVYMDDILNYSKDIKAH